MVEHNHTSSSSREHGENSFSPIMVWLGRIVRFVTAVIIIGIGVLVAMYWLSNRPTAQRRPPEIQATLVDVTEVGKTTERVVIRTMGTVTPARSVHLSAQVPGRVIDIDTEFVPGGYFKKDQRILQIEPRDYELAVHQRESDLAKARSALQVEMGQQAVAQREYELLGQEVDEEERVLLLRKPQLEMAEAAVSAAEAALKQAHLNLERTEVTSPFNAMVQTRNVDIGSQVSTGASLATLIGADEYWITVSIPVDELQWICFPSNDGEEGSTAYIYYESAWGTDAFREGRVIRLLTELEPEGRMARLVVSLTDPLDLNSPADRALQDIIVVPRTALREGNKAWVMLPDNTLDVRDVTIVWSGNEHVWVAGGLNEGDLLITSDLNAPVDGMKLRTAGAREASTPLNTENTVAPEETL